MSLTLIILIALSLIFDYTNGVRDSSNIVATMITSRAMAPRAALALTAARDPGGFESEYAELKGDALLAKGDRDGARTAYQTALDKLPPQSPYQRLLAMKRDNLGPGASP